MSGPAEPMPTAKPLHVQVAIALEPGIESNLVQKYQHNVSSASEGGDFPRAVDLGFWYVRRYLPADHDCEWLAEGDPCVCMKQWDELIRRFDRDWEETGPLIEKFVIELTAFPGGWRATAWRPFAIPQTVTRADGTTALEAVCRLIVELGRAGKLAP